MQSVPAWETQHFQGSYQEKRFGIGYKEQDRKTWELQI